MYSRHLPAMQQGCQMVYSQTKNTNLGEFLRALEWKRLVYSWAIWNVHMYVLRLFCTFLWPFGDLVANWNIFLHFGTLCHEKSGNPALQMN
jgi:hypothetical protein